MLSSATSSRMLAPALVPVILRPDRFDVAFVFVVVSGSGSRFDRRGRGLAEAVGGDDDADVVGGPARTAAAQP